MNNIALYKAHNGEVRNRNGWCLWAIEFFGAGKYYEYRGLQTKYEGEAIMLPDDWFERVTHLLKLQLTGSH